MSRDGHFTSSTSLEALAERCERDDEVTKKRVCSGIVTVRSLETGDERDVWVEVFAEQMNGHMTPEDAARSEARRQCDGHVETLDVDVS